MVEYDGSGNILRRYVPGQAADETLVWYEGSGLSAPNWLHTDEQGSVIAASNASGAGTLYAYSATGEPQGGFASGGPIFRYTGQAQLAAVGLYYYKARVYDPASGRFLQTDPAGYSAGMNLYAYAQNNSANFVDIDGLEPCAENSASGDDIETVHSCGSGMSGYFLGMYGNGRNSLPPERILEAPIPDKAPRGTNNGHSYDGDYKVCRKGSKNCTPDQVYQCLRENPAPFVSGAPVTEGQHVNVPLFGPIVTSVSPQTRVIVNSTLEGHELFPGGVIRTVTENDNWIGVDTAGWGTGPMGGLNTALAPWVWSYQTSIWISGCVRAGK